jgi:biotin carboxyl carrier protein
LLLDTKLDCEFSNRAGIFKIEVNTMAVEKKNLTAAGTKNLAPRPSGLKKEQATPQTAVKKEPPPVQPEVKQEPMTESPPVKQKVSETSAKQTNSIAIIAVPLFGAIWYMVCLVILL